MLPFDPPKQVALPPSLFVQIPVDSSNALHGLQSLRRGRIQLDKMGTIIEKCGITITASADDRNRWQPTCYGTPLAASC